MPNLDYIKNQLKETDVAFEDKVKSTLDKVNRYF